MRTDRKEFINLHVHTTYKGRMECTRGCPPWTPDPEQTYSCGCGDLRYPRDFCARCYQCAIGCCMCDFSNKKGITYLMPLSE